MGLTPNSIPDRINPTQNDHPAARFEPFYAQANRNPDHIPWATLQPHPALHQWLTQQTPTPTNAIVIGCGLGDDAQALANAGFTVTAFDISPTAIAWCQQRFPNSPVHYTTADLFDLPTSWHHAFHLVWESRTIQSLPLSVRPQAIAAPDNRRSSCKNRCSAAGSADMTPSQPNNMRKRQCLVIPVSDWISPFSVIPVMLSL